LIRLGVCFIYMVGYLLHSLPTLKRMKNLDSNMDVAMRDALIHQTPKHWSKVFLKLAGTKVIIEGKENIPDGPVVLVSNHEGNFDIPVILGYLDKPTGFISKIEVKKVPLLASWMEVMNCVFLDRSDRMRALQSIRQGVNLLKQGHSLVIFPEGTRSKGGPIGKFKTGSFRLAVDAKVPIVPISISGTSDLFERNHRLIKPGTVRVVIGEPVVSHLYANPDMKELAIEVRDVIISQRKDHKKAS
jgi:1-acyl-sn-glycerol-3-phosphate acyltransferase